MSGTSGERNHGSDPADADALPVSDLAARLGVTLPRLQRALKRPDFAGHVRKEQRATRTGTRTVTLVSVSVLPDLESLFRESGAAENGQKRERSRPEVLPSEAPEAFRAFAAMLTQQMQERITEQAATIADLRAERDRALLEKAEAVRQRETLRAELSELLALQSADAARADITSGADGPGAEHPREQSPGSLGGTGAGATSGAPSRPGGREAAQSAGDGSAGHAGPPEGPQKGGTARRSLWRRLFGGG